jgi:PAS domain S-box-containing protein
MDPIEPELPPARPHDALVTTSLAGRVLGWSRGAAALFGWREREILGRPLDELLHEKHRAVDAQTVSEAGAGHCVRDTMVKYVRRDGAVLACLQTTIPLRDATGRVTAVVRIIFDLTSLREAERALRRMSAQVAELASGGGAETPAAGSELARAVRLERERTREQYLRVVEGEARQLGEELCADLASAAAQALRADEAELVHA